MNVLRKRFSRDEVQQLEDAGLLGGERYERINGNLIDKMGQHPPHARSIRLLGALFRRIFGAELVQIQLPCEVDKADQERSLPEPDLAVLTKVNVDFAVRHPGGHELLLAIEIADTTGQHDLTVKRDSYARAGVPEYWVLDIVKRELWIHRHPAAGKYEVVSRLSESDVASPESRPQERLKVSDLLPPSSATI